MKYDLVEGKKICFTTQNFESKNNYDGTFSLQILDYKTQKINFSIVEEEYEKIKNVQTINIEFTPLSKIFLGVSPYVEKKL